MTETDESKFETMRRENRLACRLPAVVEGWDKDGLKQDVAAQCVSISRRGACVVTPLEVALGEKLTLALPTINAERKEMMVVVWAREVEGERHVGLGPIDEDTFVIFSDAAVTGGTSESAAMA
ncbi:MAG: PilZ domain-containing protein [Chloracidobacterium sp.]|uniref:PilZ domain-containing protein n=1 Tax=Chloracidobacterium validum TaxID=2821543 RepID=A0ABX8B8R7_9BACT|nr:PilZ domain-containing protein [Chloracidobacterium validum]QUW02020.1 PilZ domain-containing protein [Chloracidobacterium validum]